MHSRSGQRNRVKDLVETPQTIFGTKNDYAEKVISDSLGRRYIEYRKRWIEASKRGIITDFPLYIQIESVGKCNLRCPTCIHGIKRLRESYSSGFRPLEMRLFKSILREAKQYGCPSISFHNNDEPLLLKDLEQRIRLAKKAGFLDIILTTNATLLNRVRARKLLNSGITKISFSVDTFNEVDYKHRRVGGDFNTVLRNINYFLIQKKKANLKLPITRVTSILTRFSVKNKDKFFEFWKEKVDMVEFQNFQAIKGYTEKYRPVGSRINKKFACNSPWQQLVIRANGDVLPCCSFYGVEMVLGNVKRDSLHDIWNSDKMKTIRGELLKGNFDFSPACKKCPENLYVV